MKNNTSKTEIQKHNNPFYVWNLCLKMNWPTTGSVIRLRLMWKLLKETVWCKRTTDRHWRNAGPPCDVPRMAWRKIAVTVGVLHGECAVRDWSRRKCYMGTEVDGSATWGVCCLWLKSTSVLHPEYVVCEWCRRECYAGKSAMSVTEVNGRVTRERVCCLWLKSMGVLRREECDVCDWSRWECYTGKECVVCDWSRWGCYAGKSALSVSEVDGSVTQGRVCCLWLKSTGVLHGEECVVCEWSRRECTRGLCLWLKSTEMLHGDCVVCDWSL